MKIFKNIAVAAFTTLTLASCGGGMSSQPVNAEGFKEIETELNSEFGDNAYYTDLSVGYSEGVGTWIGATVTDKPESLEMGEWTMSQNTWTQSSEVTIEIPEGTKASDFMFQLNDNISLSKLGGLVEESMKKLTAEKKIENPALSLAYIKFPDNGDMSKAQYVVQLEPENGGTSFTYFYGLNGDFIEMNY